MVYFHICEFAGKGWAFQPSVREDTPPRKSFGLDATPNYATQERCEKATGKWASKVGYTGPAKIVLHTEDEIPDE